jgi:Protein of unknown function (DUF2459)
MRRERGRGLVLPMVAAGLVGLAAGLWTWTAPGDPTLWPARSGDIGVEATILNNGFHTDLALPRAALEARGGPLGEAVRSLPAGDWVLIGWGDAKFYVDQSPIGDRLPDGARAFVRPGNASVIMLDPAQRDPRLTYAQEGRRTFRLSAAGFDHMAAKIEGSLDLSSGSPRIAAVRAGDDARFFASREHFSVVRLCNHWTAGVLHAAGMPIRPVRSIVSSEVMATVDRAMAPGVDTPDARD